MLAECPFCGSDVSEDLVLFGGTCPKCFAEIPGEEAATDPGVEVKAAQDRRDHRRARVRAVAGLSALLMLVSCTGVVALVMVLWPEPKVAEVLDFDTLGLPEVEIVGAGGAETPNQTGGARPRSAAERAELFVNDGAADRGSSPRLSNDPAGTSASPRLRTEINTVSPELGGGAGPTPRPSVGTSSMSIDAPRVRRDENLVLDDPTAIRQMIGEYMVEYIPGLTVCYERRLKLKPTLSGRWKLAFNVETSGAVSDVSVAAVDKRDSELEKCLVDHVASNWRFGKITMTQPIQKTVKFASQ